MRLKNDTRATKADEIDDGKVIEKIGDMTIKVPPLAQSSR
jgi:hypothetical protein